MELPTPVFPLPSKDRCALAVGANSWGPLRQTSEAQTSVALNFSLPSGRELRDLARLKEKDAYFGEVESLGERQDFNWVLSPKSFTTPRRVQACLVRGWRMRSFFLYLFQNEGHGCQEDRLRSWQRSNFDPHVNKTVDLFIASFAITSNWISSRYTVKWYRAYAMYACTMCVGVSLDSW